MVSAMSAFFMRMLRFRAPEYSSDALPAHMRHLRRNNFIFFLIDNRSYYCYLFSYKRFSVFEERTCLKQG